MSRLLELPGNYVMTVAICSWIAAQIIKTGINFFLSKKFDPERLVGAGGMPSSHSALVCSMTLAMARKTGIDSPTFALAFLFAAVVMYDAMGVRRAAGEHAKVLNRFFMSLPLQRDALMSSNKGERRKIAKPEREKTLLEGKTEEPYKKLKEYLGHTPLEVMCGALLGILIAMLVPVY